MERLMRLQHSLFIFTLKSLFKIKKGNHVGFLILNIESKPCVLFDFFNHHISMVCANPWYID